MCQGLYYVCGYVSRKILKGKSCKTCVSFLEDGNSHHPAAELVTFKSRGQLKHPNKYLFEFLNRFEDSFALHCSDFDVFEKVINEITENFNFKYPCSLHLVDVTVEIIVYYLQMQMRQFTYQENLK